MRTGREAGRCSADPSLCDRQRWNVGIYIRMYPTSPQTSFKNTSVRDCLAPVQFLATRYPAGPGARGAMEQGPLAH